MKKYKQPKTRIKRVKDGNGERFYAQYKQVIVPYLWWEWQTWRESFEDDFHFPSLEDAKEALDKFLRRSKTQWILYHLQKVKPKIKKEVEYIKYP